MQGILAQSESLLGGSFDMFVALVIIGLIVEAIVDTLKPFWDPEKRENLIDRIVALAVGVLVAVFGGFNIFVILGVPLDQFGDIGLWVGVVLTGVLISRGANFLHEFYKRIAGLKAPV